MFKLFFVSLIFSLLVFAKVDVIGIDVRTWPEQKLNPAPHSLAISRGDLEKELKEKKVDKDQKMVIFCESGGRAGQALKILSKLGYKNVENIGSWREWNKDYAPLHEESHKKTD